MASPDPFIDAHRFDRAVNVLLTSGHPECPEVREAAALLWAFRPDELHEVYNDNTSLFDCIADEHDDTGGSGGGPGGYDFVNEASVDEDAYEPMTPTDFAISDTEHLIAYTGTIERIAVTSGRAVPVDVQVSIDGVPVWDDVTGASGDELFTGLLIPVLEGQRITAAVRSGDVSNKVRPVVVRVYQNIA